MNRMLTADEAQFSCRVLTYGTWTVLELAGELDLTHTDQARKALLDVGLTRHGRLALDLRGLSFMDSNGIRLVLQALYRAEAHDAQFALIRGPDAIQHVLELVGLADQLRIVDDPVRLERHA